jgi:hypothetical protein
MRRRVRRDLATHPQWAALDEDLLHLFRSWFNRGFLNLQRIDWRTSALVLERLIEYEAVHQINGWSDLRRRLEADRRCFAFFHPALPEEPLIFIEVALTRELSATVQPLIDPRSPVADPANASHAIFYSITNCQEGLRGVSFGHFLIKQVAEDLGREFPRLRKFATLSPVPGFRRWLTTTAASLADGRRAQELADVIARVSSDPRHKKVSIGSLPQPLGFDGALGEGEGLRRREGRGMVKRGQTLARAWTGRAYHAQGIGSFRRAQRHPGSLLLPRRGVLGIELSDPRGQSPLIVGGALKRSAAGSPVAANRLAAGKQHRGAGSVGDGKHS